MKSFRRACVKRRVSAAENSCGGFRLEEHCDIFTPIAFLKDRAAATERLLAGIIG
jgi:hypothetical protein